jgi:hypothetical protein
MATAPQVGEHLGSVGPGLPPPPSRGTSFVFFRLTLIRPMLCAVLIGACVALAMLPISPAAAQNPPSSGGTVVICEATGNPNAPYVEVDVAQSDLGNFSAAEGDIIPAPSTGCPAKVAGTTGPAKPHHKHRVKPKPAPTPARSTTPATTPSPTLSTAPPAAATQPATTAAPDNDSQATPSHTLPTTGGHTEITVVLGLLLLYCGGVIRWAVSAPGPASARRGPAPRI